MYAIRSYYAVRVFGRRLAEWFWRLVYRRRTDLLQSGPAGVFEFERDYPFGWLGILSESPPPDHELIYSYTDRGFALYTMRSMSLARLYLQCEHDEEIDNWSDARIWDELHKRLGGA